MYLILFDAEGNVTPEVFRDGVDVIIMRTVREDRVPTENPSKEIRLRRSARGDPTLEPTMALIPCEEI